MSFDLAVGSPPSPPSGPVAIDAAPAPRSRPAEIAAPTPPLLPATYVDPASGVVVLQTRGVDGTVETLPNLRQLDAYHSGALAVPDSHTGVTIAAA